MPSRSRRIITLTFGIAFLFVASATFGETEPGAEPPSSPANAPTAMLDAGFRDLYQLSFSQARSEFVQYEMAEPNDPLGKAAEAASYLYEEFDEKKIFSSSFFLNDSKLFGGIGGNAEENHNEAFLDTNREARDMAKERLASNPDDSRGLLVLTLADGMESDYDAIIEKKQLAGLGLMRQAEAEASKLLMIDPMAQDAYVALGASNYIIGCLPAYKRIFLRIGGIHGDRARGIQLMEIAADHGRYLAPFAKILLALAYEREHQMDRARALLADLNNEFPGNPLFAQELALAERGSPQNR